MKTQGKVWILFDSEKKQQTKAMSTLQTQVVLLSIKNSDRFFLWTPGWDKWASVTEFLSSDQKYFAIIKPPAPPIIGEVKSHIEEPITVTKSFHGTSGNSAIYTQVMVGEEPLKAIDTGYYFQDFNGNEFDMQKVKDIKQPDTTKKKSPLSKNSENKSQGSDRRSEPRHNFKIEVVLVSKSRSFRSYSRNISLSGTMLEDEIPNEFKNMPFDLIIVNPFDTDPMKARLLFRAKIVGDLVDPRRLMFIEQDVSMTLRLDALLKAYVAYQKVLHKGVA